MATFTAIQHEEEEVAARLSKVPLDDDRSPALSLLNLGRLNLGRLVVSDESCGAREGVVRAAHAAAARPAACTAASYLKAPA